MHRRRFLNALSGSAAAWGVSDDVARAASTIGDPGATPVRPNDDRSYFSEERLRAVIDTSLPIVKNPQPVIEPDWLQTGTLCVPLDFDASFTPASFARADLFVTDDLEQFRRYQSLGYFEGIQEPTGDLGSIVNGNGPTRPDGTPIVISANLGLGILDVALGARILQLAEDKDVGTQLPL